MANLNPALGTNDEIDDAARRRIILINVILRLKGRALAASDPGIAADFDDVADRLEHLGKTDPFFGGRPETMKGEIG